jgi:hypothetical protein
VIRFLNKANIIKRVVSASIKIAHHHPSILIFGLSVEGNDLCTNLEMRDWIIVAAGDLSCMRVDP